MTLGELLDNLNGLHAVLPDAEELPVEVQGRFHSAPTDFAVAVKIDPESGEYTILLTQEHR